MQYWVCFEKSELLEKEVRALLESMTAIEGNSKEGFKHCGSEWRTPRFFSYYQTDSRSRSEAGEDRTGMDPLMMMMIATCSD